MLSNDPVTFLKRTDQVEPKISESSVVLRYAAPDSGSALDGIFCLQSR